MITVEDLSILRALVDPIEKSLDQARAAKNIFHSLDALHGATGYAVARAERQALFATSSALKKFDSLPGIEKLREVTIGLEYCREDWLQKFTMEQLVQIWRAWLATEKPECYPDDWTEAQLRAALE